MSLPDSTQPVVRMRRIVKSFAGVVVVNGVDLDLFPGQVHALAGENGAGKSTLMKILAGIHHPDSGTVEIDGVQSLHDVRARSALGVSIVHQELLIAPNLSVADNLAMGREYRSHLRTLDRRETRARAREQLSRVGATFSELERAGSLSTGQQQLVEIARALAQNPKVLILDEPTASLSAREVANLFGIVRGLRAEGTALVYITHRMDEIEELADVVTVLRDGQLVETLPKSAASPEAIVTRMVGRPIEALFTGDKPVPGEVALRVRGVGDGKKVGPIDLDIRRGEIVGVAGLVGSGRSEFARLLFGADRRATGEVMVNGDATTISGPRDAMRAGIALVPESRKEQGLVLGQSVSSNIVMASLGRVSRAGLLRLKSVREASDGERQRLGIRVASLEQRIRELSGGNQQKVLLAKWLRTKPAVLILDEPTRGVDVGAKADIYAIITQSATAGMAVLVISSELPELLGLTDRIVVMRQGRLVADLPAAGLSEETVMQHAFGLSSPGAPKTATPLEEAQR